MAENDEKLEEKREKIIRGVIYENLHKSELYRECIERGVCWEELFSCYIEHDPKCNDNIYVEVLWDP